MLAFLWYQIGENYIAVKQYSTIVLSFTFQWLLCCVLCI